MQLNAIENRHVLNGILFDIVKILPQPSTEGIIDLLEHSLNKCKSHAKDAIVAKILQMCIDQAPTSKDVDMDEDETEDIPGNYLANKKKSLNQNKEK